MKRGILGWGWRERGTPLWWKPSPTPPLLWSYLTLSFPHEETSHQKTSPPLSPFTWLCLKTVKICCWLKTNPPFMWLLLLPLEMNCLTRTTSTGCTQLFLISHRNELLTRDHTYMYLALSNAPWNELLTKDHSYIMYLTLLNAHGNILLTKDHSFLYLSYLFFMERNCSLKTALLWFDSCECPWKWTAH